MHNHLKLIGASFCLLAVAIGAFGAHALKDLLIQLNRTDTFQTAVQYQMFHALALLWVGSLPIKKASPNILKWSGWLFVSGIILFSGSLYVLSVTGWTSLGAVAPLGGISFLLGWSLLIRYLLIDQPA